MIDEHSLRHDPLTANPTMRKNGHVRIFVRRRPACGVGHRVRSTDMERLTSLVETTLTQKRKRSRQRKSIIVINYKPVFMNTRPRKTKSVPPKAPAPETKPEPQPVPKQPGAPYDLLEVEDPFMFIEEMYQQLFNDDGQLRQGTEPKALANCMKHIVATSRRNSMARRESVSSPVRQRKASIPSSSYYSQFKANQPPSVSSSSHVLSNTFSEEEENEADTLVHTNPSLRRRTSVNTSHSHRISLDDTENEDWDRFSDLNTYRKTMALSLAASLDDDMPPTDSKLLSSSGYQSLKSPSPRYCSNCTQPSSTPELSSNGVSSSSNILQRLQQPLREMFTKYLHLFLVSKNILLVPLFIFFLQQRATTL